MISRKLAFPSGAQKSVGRGALSARPPGLFADEKSRRYDPDAQKFFSANGVRSSLEKNRISSFAKGLKKLGLWNQFACFPMRRGQSSASATLRSLGGLGSYTMTLQNSPTRADAGIYFLSGSSQVGITNFSFSTNNLWLGCDLAMDDPGIGGQILAQFDEAADVDFSLLAADTIRMRANFGSGMAERIAISGTDTYDRQFVQVSHNGLSFQGKVNAIAALSEPGVGTITQTTPLSVGAALNNGNAFEGIDATIGFVFMSTLFPSETQQNQLYALYKSTLSQGLGLP